MNRKEYTKQQHTLCFVYQLCSFIDDSFRNASSKDCKLKKQLILKEIIITRGTWRRQVSMFQLALGGVYENEGQRVNLAGAAVWRHTYTTHTREGTRIPGARSSFSTVYFIIDIAANAFHSMFAKRKEWGLFIIYECVWSLAWILSAFVDDRWLFDWK